MENQELSCEYYEGEMFYLSFTHVEASLSAGGISLQSRKSSTLDTSIWEL